MSDAVRSEIRRFLGFDVEHNASKPEIEEVVREDDFVRKTISYAGSDREKIQAFLFEPLVPKRDAVVIALHQHNSEWALGKSEIAGLAGDPLQAFGPALARSGVTVLAPDAVGFESRRASAAHGTFYAPPNVTERGAADDWLQYYNHAMHRLVRGELLMAKLLRDVSLAITVARSVTAAERVGLVGHSFGGNVAMFAAAMDTRIAFTCASASVCSYRHKLAQGIGLEMSLVIPGFATRFDVDDLLRCVAPRKLFVVSSDADPMSADADDLVARAKHEFEAAGSVEHLNHLRVTGGHALDQGRHSAIVEWICSNTSEA